MSNGSIKAYSCSLSWMDVTIKCVCSVWFWPGTRLFGFYLTILIFSPIFLISAGITNIFLALSGTQSFPHDLHYFPDEEAIQKLEDQVLSAYFKGTISHQWVLVDLKISGVTYKCKAHVLSVSSSSDSTDVPKMLWVHGTASSATSFV